MFLEFLNFLKSLIFFTGSYSNAVFPEPLSKKEEELAIIGAKQGDKASRSKLIEHNLRLVAHIVKKFEHDGKDQDDLISIGTIGLIKGIDTYSPEKTTKLTTYCARCIENEILMYFRSNNKNTKNVSLNESIGYDKDGNEISMIDILKTPDVDYVEEIHTKDKLKLLETYFHVLNAREKEILIRRYGLQRRISQTQKAIAKDLHISRSYVSRIEKRALTKILREFLKNNISD